MNERGIGYIADMLVFALVVSVSGALLIRVSPVDPRTTDDRYASAFVESTIIALQYTTADELGGVEYALGFSGLTLDLPILRDSARRELHHKTLMQLLVEDALCNLRIEAAGVDIDFIKLCQDMDTNVKNFLKSALDRLIGGRFKYRLIARSVPVDLSILKVCFETVIGDLRDNTPRVFSKTVTMAVPVPWQELISRVENVCHLDLSEFEIEPNAVVEITLEMWSDAG